MAKRIIKIVCVLLMCALLLTGCDAVGTLIFSGCKAPPEMETDYFYYGYLSRPGDVRCRQKGDYIVITGLTSLGSKQERLIFPDYIEEKPVVQIGMSGFMGGTGITDWGYAFTKLYLPKYLESFGQYYPNRVDIKIFFLYTNSQQVPAKYESSKQYVSEESYNELVALFGLCKAYMANISYLADGKTFFIDDCNDGEYLVKPDTDPIKEGKTFVGWFKEEECINEWIFNEDVFCLNEGEKVMKLYAKWQ